MLYLIAGMNRSGSTWLFNAVRLLLERSGVPDVSAGWVDDRAEVLRHETAVLKLHEYDPHLLTLRWPCAVLVSHRDPRDVIASMARKFGSEPSSSLARHIFAQYQQWSRHAVHDMRYESMIADPSAELARIAAVLGLTETQVDFGQISAEIGTLSDSIRPDETSGFDRTTLLHAGHVTDGRHGSWEGQIPPTVVEEIEREFGDWMESRGYLGVTTR